jgi:hypothetical protein
MKRQNKSETGRINTEADEKKPNRQDESANETG